MKLASISTSKALLCFSICCFATVGQAVASSTCKVDGEPGGDVVVCSLSPTAVGGYAPFGKCDIREDGGLESCECNGLVGGSCFGIPGGGRDCSDITIEGCTVYCYSESCENTTFVASDVVALLVNGGGNDLRLPTFRDSNVTCDNSGGNFINSNVYGYSCGNSVFENSRVYSHTIALSDFRDSKVTCDSCRNSVFERSEVRCLNLNVGGSTRTCYSNTMKSSQVTCDLPIDNRTGFSNFCGIFSGCSCCRGPGCERASGVASNCTNDFCGSFAPYDEALAANHTCTDEGNPFCNAGPFCQGGSIGAFWGDPHIVTFDGLQYECQVEGETVLLRSTDRSRQINGLFTKVGDYWTLTTGIAVKSPFFSSFTGGQVLQVLVSNEVVDSGEEVGGCGIQFYEGQAPMSSEDIFRRRSFVRIDIPSNSDHLVLNFPTLGIELTLAVENFGGVCLFSTRAKLSCEHDHGYLEGLLGNANLEDCDDWNSFSTGQSIPIPADRSGKEAYEYCASWCVSEAGDSLFPGPSYADSTFFATNSNCSAAYSNPLETTTEVAQRQLLDIDPAVQAVCGDDVSCWKDGITLGVDAAQSYLVNKDQIMTLQKELSPGGTFAPDPSASPSALPSAEPSPFPSTGSAPATDEDEKCTAFFLICFFRRIFSRFF